MLLSYGCATNIPNKQDLASQKVDAGMMKLLLRYQAEIDISAVCAAYEYGHGEVTHILDVNGGHCTWCDLTLSSEAGEGEDMEGEGFAE